jgi:hydrogenase small subunit
MAEKVSSITKAPAVSDVHILWITAGLGCDGDSVSVTAAEQPSIEDVLLGAIPGLPKVHLHNPVLAYENGDEFMKFFYEAEKGLLEPFVLVVEGSIPNEKIKKEGYWAAMGTNPDTGQPITTCEWIDRLAPKAWPSSARERVPRTVASTRWLETRPDAWGLPTTSDGTGVPRPVCPL